MGRDDGWREKEEWSTTTTTLLFSLMLPSEREIVAPPPLYILDRASNILHLIIILPYLIHGQQDKARYGSMNLLPLVLIWNNYFLCDSPPSNQPKSLIQTLMKNISVSLARERGQESPSLISQKGRLRRKIIFLRS